MGRRHRCSIYVGQMEENLAKGVSPDMIIKEYTADFFESSSLSETRKLLFKALYQ